MKSVPVSPQARTALGIDATVSALSPDELISAILAAPVDLLWNGGIGTYVKASSESHADAGDRSNGHDGKALTEILEGYPLEELFEISTEQLVPIARGVLGLGERKQVRLFLRPDALRPVRILPGIPAQGPVHDPGQAARAGVSCASALRRRTRWITVPWSATRRWPGCTWWSATQPPEGDPLAEGRIRPRCRRGSLAKAVRSWDEDLAAEAERQLGQDARRCGC